MRLLLFTILVLATQGGVPAQPVLIKAQELGLGELPGAVPAYYSKGSQARAESIRNLLADSIPFFKERLGVDQEYAIALLDSKDWSQLTEIPYGLPFVSGPPFIVCIPASSDHVLGEVVSKAIVGLALEDYGLTHSEIVNSFIELIGFHELGHIYARKYSLDFPNKWTFEFAATYLAYLYLEEYFPAKSRLWRDVSGALLDRLEPNRTSLRDFEERYVGVGVKNYAWYQVVFLEQVAQVDQELGIEFLRTWKRRGLPSNSDSEYLEELNQIHSGFLEWAMKYSLTSGYYRSSSIKSAFIQ